MKNKLTLFLLSLIFLSVATANVASGSEKNFTFTPQVGIPDSNFQTDKQIPIGEEKNGTTSSTLLADYITSFYTYALNILGVLAVLVLMAGGVQWIISGGNTKKIESAKKMIGGSLFGGFLLLGSYLLLNTINPELTKLPAIEMTTIKRVETGCCDKALDDGTAKITNMENCAESNLHADYGLDTDGKCKPYICCIEYDGLESKTVKSCSNKLSSYCQSDNKNKRSISTEACHSVAACSTAEISDSSCQGVSYGGKPSGVKKDKRLGELALINYWCYSGKLYTDIAGKEGEPCGIIEGSKCLKKDDNCKKDNYNGEGRSCSDKLICCKTNAN